ncbi:MAG: hypothetical protein AAF492_26015, partial [Verrucomicrobiota bacterium]
GKPVAAGRLISRSGLIATWNSSRPVEVAPGQTLKAGLHLDFTPMQNPDGSVIQIGLAPSFSTPLNPSSDVGYHGLEARFYARHGSTMVFGGGAVEDKDRLTYLLVTTRILNARGESAIQSPAVDRSLPIELYPVQHVPEQTDDLEARCKKAGITFPPRALVRYEKSLRSYIFRNTGENHRRFVNLLYDNGEVYSQVELKIATVNFDNRDLERAARASDAAAPSTEAIRALWKAGKGRWRGSAILVTPSGETAAYRGWVESFDNAGAAPRTNGLRLEATPTIRKDGLLIDVKLKYDRLLNEAANTRGVVTNLLLRDGGSVTMSITGRNASETTDVLFVAARVLDASGWPLQVKPDARP